MRIKRVLEFQIHDTQAFAHDVFQGKCLDVEVLEAVC